MAKPIKELGKKRRAAMVRIAKQSVGAGITAATPTPLLDILKQLGIAIADFWMCYDIWAIYFGEQDTEAGIKDMLIHAGLLTVAGGCVIYGVIKITEGVTAEFLNLAPGVGWLISGAVTLGVSASLGAAWTLMCDAYYVNQANQGGTPVLA